MGYIGKVPADVLIDPHVDSAAITDGTIITADIADDAVTSAKLAQNSVDSSELIDGSVDNSHLAGSIAINKTLLSAGTGLTLSTNTLNVDAAQTQITSVGTISTGVWQGTAIASAYLDADTAHLSGSTFTGSVQISHGTTPDFTLNDTGGTSNRRVFRIAGGGDGIYFEGRNNANSGDGDAGLMTSYSLSDGTITHHKLTHLKGSAWNNILRLGDTSRSGEQLTHINNGSVNFSIYTSNGTKGVLTANHDGSAMTLGADYGSGSLTVTPDVGIGATPRQYYMLDLYKNGNSTIFGMRSESHACTIYMQTGSTITGQVEFSTSQGWITTRTASPLKLGINNATKVTVEANGSATFAGSIGVGGAAQSTTGVVDIISDTGVHRLWNGSTTFVGGMGTNQWSHGGNSTDMTVYALQTLRLSSAGTVACTFDTSQNATFAGWAYVNNRIMASTAGGNQDIRVGSHDGNEMLHLLGNGTAKIDTAGTTALTIDSSQNASFAGNIFAGANFLNNPWDQTSGEGALYFQKGTTSQSQTFAIATNSDRGFANMYSNLINANDTGDRHIQWYNDGAVAGNITYASGSSVAYNTSGSDRTLKKNFANWTENVLDSFDKINPQLFHFKTQDDSEEKNKGFIAQEMIDKFPEAYPLVNFTEKEDMGSKYQFNPSGMVVYLMKAIQELSAEIKILKGS